MMFIIGFIVSMVTFPGIIIHELAHVIMCKLTKTKINKVCYFRLGNPAGYVIHEIPSIVWKHIIIGIGPFFINSLIGLVIGILLSNAYTRQVTNFDIFIFWLGISISMHSFPSTGDAKSIWKEITKPASPLFAKIIGIPLVGIIYVGAIGSIFWLDALYGLFIVFLPRILLHIH